MAKVYMVGDLHGSIKALESVFNKITLNPEDSLYFLGDYIDRGNESKQVLERLMKETQQNPNIHCLLGNHDQMFLNFIYIEDMLSWHNDPKLSTLRSYYPNKNMLFGSYAILGDNYKNINSELRTALLKEPTVKWLQTLPTILETEDLILVHAGVDKILEDEYLDTPKDTRLWTRGYYEIPNKTGKYIIVGHTPTTNFIKKQDFKQPRMYKLSETEWFIDTLNYQYDNARVLVFDQNKKIFTEID